MSPSECAGALLWSIVILGQWVHSQFLQPLGRLLDSLLSAWEESVRSVIREWFAVVTHAINTASGAVLSIFSGSSYFLTVKKTSSSQQAKSGAWHTYWQQATGTFNALLEREGLSSVPRALSRTSSQGSESFTTQPAAGAASAGSLQLAGNGRSTLRGRLKSWWEGRGSPAPEAKAMQGRESAEQGREAGKKAVQGSKQKGVGRSAAAGKEAPGQGGGRSSSAMLRGSELFELPSGFAVSEGSQHRGLVEEARVAAEVGVTRAFGAVRRSLRRAMWLDGSSKLPADLLASRLESRRVPLPGDTQQQQQQPHSTTPWEAAPAGGAAHAQQAQHLPSLTSHSMEDLNVWTASDIILRSGYPLEEHSVATPDGYVLQMHRIPRHGARDVVFFQHGVLDTSLGWVANGSVGSQAFAAYDAGFDVWLANSRSNAPRLHQDPKRRSSRYWHYSSNELGLIDIAAQVEHLHGVKVREILVQQRGGAGSSTVTHAQEPAAAAVEAAAQQDAQQGAELAVIARLRRSASAPTLVSGWKERSAEVGAASSGWPAGPDSTAVATAAAAAGASSFAAALMTALSGVASQTGDARVLPAGTSSSAGLAPQHVSEGATWLLERQVGAAAAAGAGSAGGCPDSAAPQVAMTAEPVQGAEQCMSPMSGERQQSRGEEGGLTFLRRTQSAGAILTAEPLGRGWGSSRQSRRKHAGAAVAAGAKQEGEPLPGGSAVVGPAAAGADSAPGGEGRAGPPAAWEGLPRRDTGRDEPLAFADHSALGAQGSEAQQWGSGVSSSDDGYATPWSTGWDTPRSGYATPHSERSVGSSLGGEPDVTPYRLQAVGHSLGAASVLIYAVGCRMMGRPHRFRRIVLMSPAGFHTHVPMALRPFKYLMPAAVRMLRAVRPGVGVGLRLPSPLLRYITFKLSMDLHHIPALHELVRAGARLLLSGDRSQWDRAVQMPHYNTYSMPWSRDPHFRLFDYGTAASNRQHYGSDVPPSIADHYHLLGPVPVDLVAGRYDGIINCQDVYLHYLHMKEAGVHVTYREYDFGHMDFTFAVKDELRHYVLSRLQRPIL